MKKSIIILLALFFSFHANAQSSWDEWKKDSDKEWERFKNGEKKPEPKPQNAQSPAQPDRYGSTRTWAVIVGVAQYALAQYNLTYTKDDAYRMWAFLQSAEGGSIPERQLRLLVDEDATRNEIMTVLNDTFSQADEDDIILLYFSGHGKQGAFLPHDYGLKNLSSSSGTVNGVKAENNKNELLHTEVSKIFEESKAKYKLCVADACYSGSLQKGTKAVTATQLSTMKDNWYTALSQSSGGLSLFMSSSANETSREVASLRQGLFTYYFLNGLKGDSDADGDKVVTLGELFDYTKENVLLNSQGKQTPSINGDYDAKMPIGVLR